jgi:hypothetical protein
MRCPGCDYPLWNLTARLCPECGRPFKPSDFDFIANSVRFCCPHCNQAYYGTGPRGHLEPVEFDCATCHRHIHMDEMVLLPTEGVKEEQTEVDTIPWLVRAKIGRVRAFLSTIGRALFEPGRLARVTPEGSPVGPAWGFSILANVACVALGALPALVLFPLIFLTAGPRGASAGAASFLLGGFAFVFVLAMACLAVLYPLWGFVAHAVLRVTGPTKGGTAASVRTLCYASGANALTAIPCIGVYLSVPGVLWTAISAAIMLRIVHGVGWFRAFVAALTLPIGVAALASLWVVLVVAPGVSTSLSLARQRVSAAPGSRVAAALSAYRSRHDNQFPPHAISLMEEGDLVASDFMSIRFGGATSPSDSTLTSFQVLTAPQQAATARGLIAALPPKTIAHRLGDVVFTYHGINPSSTTDPDLWLAVDCPTNAAPSDSMTVTLFRGTTILVPRRGLAAALQNQNDLRAAHTPPLPPLPDPAVVIAPAVAPPP